MAERLPLLASPRPASVPASASASAPASAAPASAAPASAAPASSPLLTEAQVHSQVHSILSLTSARSRRRFALSSLPALPPSSVPRHVFPFTRLRHRLYLAFSGPWTSQVGLLVFWSNVAAIALFVVSFTVASFPYYSLRSAQNLYGAPEAAFDAIDQVILAVFCSCYIVRLSCATAVPDAVEERALQSLALGGGGADGEALELTVPAAHDDNDDDDHHHNEVAREHSYCQGLGSLFDLDSMRSLRFVEEGGGTSDSLALFRWRYTPRSFVGLCRRSAPRLAWWILNVFNLIELMCFLPFFVDSLSEDILDEHQAAPLRLAALVAAEVARTSVELRDDLREIKRMVAGMQRAAT